RIHAAYPADVKVRLREPYVAVGSQSNSPRAAIGGRNTERFEVSSKQLRRENETKPKQCAEVPSFIYLHSHFDLQGAVTIARPSLFSGPNLIQFSNPNSTKAQTTSHPPFLAMELRILATPAGCVHAAFSRTF